ncbi:MAG TPA: BTAD domain-containing putative transcriptional regulator [Pseudonocardiaceae bacterium]|nr:BTAD domain-containing putative transcriptional regulator [Pseudonocardiaceae bacterium]
MTSRTAEDLEFDVLGPMAVRRGGRPVGLGTPKARGVLALLLTRPNRILSMDLLIDALWSEAPPRTAVKNIQIYVHQLRRALGDTDRIVHQSPGYRLVVHPGELDSARFSALAREGNAAGDPRRSAELFRAALELWKGEDAYADILDIAEVRAEARRLDEARVLVLLDRIDAELGLGRTAELLPELVGLTAKHPLQEGLWARLMTALYRNGRQADALETYGRARRVLADQAGLDPGPELQALQQEILAAQNAGDTGEPGEAAPGPEPPRMLPSDLADFTGREGELDELESALRNGIRVVTVSGRGGVGKTALAVRLAHRLTPVFPDGQLCADLGGAQPEPARPADVLGRFLRALGVAGADLPEQVADRAAHYRSVLATRRALVVLDNAVDEAQVRDLLPGAGACAVIVTSRARLGDLPGARGIDLDVLADPDGQQLLERITRTSHDPDTARELLRLCAGLPLAIRIAGAKLATRPHWRLADVVTRLRDERHRLDTLRYRDLGVRASFALSYHGLRPRARRLFRLVGLVDAPDFAAWTAAAVLDADMDEAAELLDEAIDARLVDFTDGRYRLHDLVRVYARECAEAEDSEADRAEALLRACGGLLSLTDAAHHAAGDGSYAAALGGAARWRPDLAAAALTSGSYGAAMVEAQALVAAVGQSVRLRRPDLAWQLALGGVPFFQQGNFLDEWRASQAVAFGACVAVGDRRGQAAMWYMLGGLHFWQRQRGQAYECYQRALSLFDELGDRHGSALVLRMLAMVERAAGQLRESIESSRRSHELLEKLGDPGAAADALVQAGIVHLELDDAGSALRVLTEAMTAAREVGALLTMAQGGYWIGLSQLRLGDPAQARLAFGVLAEFARNVGSPRADVYVHHADGLLALAENEPELARDRLLVALETARLIEDPLMQARVLHALAGAWSALSDQDRAFHCLTEALDISERLDVPLWQARAWEESGRLRLARGEQGAAREALTRAAHLFGRIGSARADVLVSLAATVEPDLADPDAAERPGD